MKALLTGANGMLGRDVMAALADRITLLPYPKEALDIADPRAVARVIEAEAPDLVINCAAYTDVDGCESQWETAVMVNALGPRNLAVAADRVGAALVHVSTDYVFDGTASAPYTEFDPVAPATAYGRSKLAGEEAVRTHCRRHYILRTAWLYGEHGGNFVHTMLKLARERERLSVVDDQVGNPTWTRDVARVIGELADTGAYGTYHATARGECSWHGFARAILKEKGIDTPVDAVTSDAFPRPAKRPAYSGLANLCLSALGIEMGSWERSLKAYLERM